MVTRSAISTISYNSFDFLVQELNSLVNERIIEFWCFIEHLPEEDETKVHKHVYLIPSTTIDTFTLGNRLKEIDINNPGLPPLGCMLWRKSKFVDWYLYSLHDADYLVTKNESRKYHYARTELICPDPDSLNELVHSSDFSQYKKFANFRESVSSGVSFADLVKNGFVPIPQIYQWSRAYELLKYNHTDRGGRFGHENDLAFDENGEILS